MMRKIAAILLSLSALPVAAKQTLVDEVRLWGEQERTRLVLDTSGSVEYKLFTLDNPPRLVVDINDAKLASRLPEPNPDERLIRRVRSGVREGNNLRMVLDLAQAVSFKGYQVAPNNRFGHRLVIELADVAPGVVQHTAPAPRIAVPAPAPRAAPAVVARNEADAEPRRVPQVNGDPVPVTRTPPVVSAPRVLVAKAEAAPAPKVARIERRPSAPVAKAPEPKPETRPVALADAPPAKRKDREDDSSLGFARERDIVVMIDAGHGGYDPGAVGGKGTLEKDVVLQIARKFAALVAKQPGMRPVLTRADDRFVEVGERMEIARENQADIFISIHADKFEDARAKGATVYVLSPDRMVKEAERYVNAKNSETALIGGVTLHDKDMVLRRVLVDLSQNRTIGDSHDVGTRVLQNLAQIGKVRKQHVLTKSLGALTAPDVPSILIETGYLSNPTEEQNLNSDAHQWKIAGSILNGVRGYFDNKPPAGTQWAEQRGRRGGGREG